MNEKLLTITKTVESDRIIKVIDSLKLNNQLDKLSYKIENQSNLINEVNNFYDSAWMKLIIVITILGIIVPVIVQYFQRKNIQDLIDGLKEKFESKLDSIKETNDLKIDLIIQRYENQIKELEAKNEKVMFEMDSNTFYLQGRTLFTEKNFMGSAFSFLRSLDYLIKCERFDRITPVVNITIKTFNQMSKIDFMKLDNLISAKFEGKNVVSFLCDFEKAISIDSIILIKTSELKKIYKEKNID